MTVEGRKGVGADVSRPWGVLGVPSSAAAHWPGIENAPAAFRAAGLVEHLDAASVAVRDFGDLPVARWEARPQAGRPNNVHGVLRGLTQARERVESIVGSGHRPFVLGGECTLVIAVVSALVARGSDVGLVYVDGGQDLMIPGEHPEEPILDGMGVAHLLDLPGAVDEIASIGPRRPLLTPRRVVFYGYADPEEDAHGLVPSARFPAADVAADPEGSASAALAGLDVEHVIVHVDVDVLDFLLTPAADVPLYGRGLDLERLTRSLRLLLSDPRCAALLLVEYNPHRDPAGRAVAGIVDALATALA